jgi:hypothetical protein
MIRVIKYPLMLLIFGLVLGCGSIKEVPVINTEKIVYRDSTIYIRDSVFIEVPKEVIKEIVPEDTTSILRTSVALSEAKIEKGMLHHRLEQKGQVKAQIDTVVTVQYVDRIIEKEVPIEVEVVKYKRDTIFWFSIIFNVIVLLLVGFKIYLKLKK